MIYILMIAGLCAFGAYRIGYMRGQAFREQHFNKAMSFFAAIKAGAEP